VGNDFSADPARGFLYWMLCLLLLLLSPPT
jgi:hypothetical protein